MAWDSMRFVSSVRQSEPSPITVPDADGRSSREVAFLHVARVDGSCSLFPMCVFLVTFRLCRRVPTRGLARTTVELVEQEDLRKGAL